MVISSRAGFTSWTLFALVLVIGIYSSHATELDVSTSSKSTGKNTIKHSNTVASLSSESVNHANTHHSKVLSSHHLHHSQHQHHPLQHRQLQVQRASNAANAYGPNAQMTYGPPGGPNVVLRHNGQWWFQQIFHRAVTEALNLGAHTPAIRLAAHGAPSYPALAAGAITACAPPGGAAMRMDIQMIWDAVFPGGAGAGSVAIPARGNANFIYHGHFVSAAVGGLRPIDLFQRTLSSNTPVSGDHLQRSCIRGAPAADFYDDVGHDARVHYHVFRIDNYYFVRNCYPVRVGSMLSGYVYFIGYDAAVGGAVSCVAQASYPGMFALAQKTPVVGGVAGAPVPLTAADWISLTQFDVAGFLAANGGFTPQSLRNAAAAGLTNIAAQLVAESDRYHHAAFLNFMLYNMLGAGGGGGAVVTPAEVFGGVQPAQHQPPPGAPPAAPGRHPLAYGGARRGMFANPAFVVGEPGVGHQDYWPYDQDIHHNAAAPFPGRGGAELEDWIVRTYAPRFIPPPAPGGGGGPGTLTVVFGAAAAAVAVPGGPGNARTALAQGLLRLIA